MANRCKQSLVLSLAFVIALVGVTRAAVVVYQTGFEAPAYSTGQLSGQNGWISNNSGTNLPVVQNTVSASGDQAGYTPRGEDTSSPLVAWRDVSADQILRPVTVTTALRVDDMADSSSYFDAFYIYDTDYQTDRAAILYFRGDGNIVIPESGVGDVDIGDWVDDTWYDIRFDLYYGAQRLDLWIDNTQVLTNFPFLEATATEIGGVAYQEYGGLTSGGFYYDDLDINGEPLPEPQTAALFLMAGAAVWQFARRRRQEIAETTA